MENGGVSASVHGWKCDFYMVFVTFFLHGVYMVLYGFSCSGRWIGMECHRFYISMGFGELKSSFQFFDGLTATNASLRFTLLNLVVDITQITQTYVLCFLDGVQSDGTVSGTIYKSSKSKCHFSPFESPG